MADTQRTRAALLLLMADNVTGDVSNQDFRDFMVTAMQEEFVFSDDAWAEPGVSIIATDKSGRGYKQYSQTIDSACSFGNIVTMNPSGTWNLWEITDSDRGVFGITLNSYAAAASNAEILRRGLIKDSALSGVLSIGKVLYAASASFAVTHTRQSDVYIMGAGEATDTYRFWPVSGKVAVE